MYPMRFERTAFGVGVQRSIQLSYGYVLCGNLSYCTAETGRMSIENYFFMRLFLEWPGPAGTGKSPGGRGGRLLAGNAQRGRPPVLGWAEGYPLVAAK